MPFSSYFPLPSLTHPPPPRLRPDLHLSAAPQQLPALERQHVRENPEPTRENKLELTSHNSPPNFTPISTSLALFTHRPPLLPIPPTLTLNSRHFSGARFGPPAETRPRQARLRSARMRRHEQTGSCRSHRPASQAEALPSLFTEPSYGQPRTFLQQPARGRPGRIPL